MSQYEKQSHKQQIKQWNADQRAELAAAMPISPEHLHQLLDYLDLNLKACDHTTKLTQVFLLGEKLDKSIVLPWLGEHGGYCDCEVLANLEDLDREFQRPPQTNYFVAEPKKKNAPRDLRTATGWELTKLPAPWRVGNLYKRDEPIQLQVGKKGNCTLRIIETPMAAGDQATDEYWSKLWYLRTELPERGPLRICHDGLELPASLKSTVVSSPNWLPVYGWIVSAAGGWHLELQTESNRMKGDLSQIAALIATMQVQP